MDIHKSTYEYSLDFSLLMMNISIVLASILISLAFQLEAKLDQTEQLSDEEKIKYIIRKDAGILKQPQA